MQNYKISVRSKISFCTSFFNFRGMQRMKHFTLSCKINCYFRAFLPSPFCPSINLFLSHISLSNFLPFPERNHRISSGNSGKGGDGLIAIPSRPGRLFLSRCPLLSSRHYNPSAYNFSARPDRRLRVVGFFSNVAIRSSRERRRRQCLLKNEE